MNMKDLAIVKIIFLILIFEACNLEKTSTKPKKQISFESIINAPTTKLVSSSTKSVAKVSDTVTTIRFNELDVSISRLVAWDEEGALKEIQNDTTYVVNDIGESVLGQTLTMSNTNLDDIKVEQRYQTSVSIANEGPHCDLLDWKHYTSGWTEIQKLNDLKFICKSYTDEERKQFPAIPVNQLKEFVKKQCGGDWFLLIKDIKQPNEGASWVGISKVFLRITGTDRLSKIRIVKIITFEEAMGC